MSKFISVYSRGDLDPAEQTRRLEHALGAIAPDVVAGRARVAVRVEGRHAQGTLNWPDALPRRGLGLCQGKIYATGSDAEAPWWRPGSGHPDGSYALVREDPAALEVLSDPAGSRMVWCYFDDRLFVASNSERAATIAAGRFELDPAVLPWMLSSGTPGPGLAYNRHLRLLPPATVARLDKAAWSLDLRTEEIRFAEIPRSRAAHLAALREALSATFATFTAEDAASAVIALSGGVDSRAVAGFLAAPGRAPRWRSCAWGAPKALAAPLSDVAVAARVAERFGTEHRLIGLRPEAPEPDEVRVARFIQATEGRHDRMHGLDGIALWAMLAEEGVAVMLRGDEGMGWKPVAPDGFAVRRSMDLLLCADIANLAPRLETFGLAGQALPEQLRQRPGESFATWRDRLYHGFRIPTLLAALTETKATCFEVVNPLLSGRALAVARALPDDLRTDKALFRELVAALAPDLPLSDEAGPARDGLMRNLQRPDIRRLFEASLGSATAERHFGPALTGWLGRELARADGLPYAAWQSLRRRMAKHRLAPAALARPWLHPRRLAFRVHIVTVMADRLTADAALFGPAAARAEAS